MRNDVEKMNNFQNNIQQNNQFNNILCTYRFTFKKISKESNIHFSLLSKILSIFKYQKQLPNEFFSYLILSFHE